MARRTLSENDAPYDPELPEKPIPERFPCVWCEEEAVNLEIDLDAKMAYVLCPTCSATGPVEMTSEEAVSRWNALWERIQRLEKAAGEDEGDLAG